MVVNMEQHVTIKFCQKAGFNARKTHEMLKKVYGDVVLKCTAVFEWFSCFCDDRNSPYNDKKTGCSSSSRINENNERVTTAIKNLYFQSK